MVQDLLVARMLIDEGKKQLKCTKKAAVTKCQEIQKVQYLTVYGAWWRLQFGQFLYNAHSLQHDIRPLSLNI